MKQTIAFLVLYLAVAASALQKQPVNSALSKENLVEQETSDPRFAFLDVDDDGATLTFNSTSLQYAVVIGVVLLILGLVVVPLLGFDLANIFSARDDYNAYGYGYDQDNYYSSYTSYAKRSLNVLSPVLKALAQTYTKYE
ncbi:uncharacterized protein LOC123508706 [Portunus trituberculatus]|uniref:uncharacterized protein LOC123508706 n=1 Tax=Portunus trituberculatus TaxID=210409 RepID=UPI001E1D0739|nr:uncharacterized protein LOC123508706 [Portunus trituberculatus]